MHICINVVNLGDWGLRYFSFAYPWLDRDIRAGSVIVGYMTEGFRGVLGVMRCSEKMRMHQSKASGAADLSICLFLWCLGGPGGSLGCP